MGRGREWIGESRQFGNSPSRLVPQRQDGIVSFGRRGGSLASTDTDTDTRTRPTVSDGGDHDKFAHYVRKTDITSSAVGGHEVIALCGKKWVPTRLPDEFPVCPDCKKIYDQLKSSG